MLLRITKGTLNLCKRLEKILLTRLHFIIRGVRKKKYSKFEMYKVIMTLKRLSRMKEQISKKILNLKVR